MFKKQIHTCLLLGIIALQLLPVREMGEVLFKGNLTEEVCDASEHSEDDNTFKNNKRNIEAVGCMRTGNIDQSLPSKSLQFIHDIRLHSRESDAPPTRPPLI